MCVLCTVYTVKSLWFISVAPVVVAGGDPGVGKGAVMMVTFM